MKSMTNLFEGVVNNVLCEMANDYEYHFTTLGALMNILNTGHIKLSAATDKVSEFNKSKGKYPYYLSMTRVYSNEVGYSKGYNVRICLNGYALNQKYHVEPYDYWGSLYDGQNDNKQHTENEDRVFSMNPFMDIDKYCVSFDILFDENDRRFVNNDKNKNETLRCIVYCLNSGYSNKVRVFGNKKDFNNPKSSNIINDKIREIANNDRDTYFYQKKLLFPDRSQSYAIDYLAKFFHFIVYDLPKGEKPRMQAIAIMLKKYGLNKYLKFVKQIYIKSCQIWYTSIDDIFNGGNIGGLDELGRDSDDKIAIEHLIFGWIKSHGFKSASDILKWIKQMKEKSRTNGYIDIDWNKKITFIVFGDYICPYPDKEDFWVFGINDGYSKNDLIYYKENFVNEFSDWAEENQIQVRNGDYNRFRIYLKKFTHGCTVSQMYDLCKRMGLIGRMDEIYCFNRVDFSQQELTYEEARQKHIFEQIGHHWEEAYDIRDNILGKLYQKEE